MTALDFDTTYDVRTDAGGKDPDTFSPTLHRYHKMLWTKPLPNGTRFDLGSSNDGKYLIHRGGAEELWLASDSVVATYSRYGATQQLIAEVGTQPVEEFLALGYTIGGFVLWPAGRIDGKMTINGARGFYRKISDRFDLTLECVRRHYAGETSPLSEVFDRYAHFFALFDDFAGYVDFWLLQDAVTQSGEVRFCTEFDDFRRPAIPKTVAEYEQYRAACMEFLHARNARMREWVASSV